MKPTIALTIGDPNGIGPEIAVKAAAKLAREGGPEIVLVGDQFVVRHYAELCAKDFVVRPFDGAPAESGCLRLLAVEALPRDAFSPGTPLAAGGRATVDYVAAAMRFMNDGHAAAIVACPHSETNVNAAGIRFSGYPSLLAQLKNVPEDERAAHRPRYFARTATRRAGPDHARIGGACNTDSGSGLAEAEYHAATHRTVRNQPSCGRGRTVRE
jgi:4-hydroxy-L-threonine phosphate dehydrogenase PdxA